MKKLLSVLLAAATACTLLFSLAASGASFRLGDLNNDSLYNGKDANLLVRYLCGEAMPEDTRAYDINQDGFINGKDALLLVKELSGEHVIIQPADSTPIADYTVIYPENATQYEQYAAELLCDYVKDNCGVTLAAAADTAAEVENEILIGNTSRTESATGVTLATDEYLLKKDGGKLILNGSDYMIGAAVGALTYDYTDGSDFLTDDIPTTDTAAEYTPKDADSVILMIGDGMGFNHVAFTDLYMHSTAMSAYTYTHFAASDMPNKGSCTTYALSAFNTANSSFTKVTTDSAAAATALSTGWKTNLKYLGMSPFGSSLTNVRELAQSKGYKTAVMSTEPMTGATPAGFTVHNISRYNTEEIATAQQALVDNGSIDYMKGAVYDELLSETKTALDTISTGSDGFFAMIEEAYIDKACDSSYQSDGTAYTRKDIAYFVYRFDLAIQYAMTFTASRPDTVLIVTADHETGGLSTNGSVTSNGTHTNANVPVYAMGKGTEIFNGTTVDNTDIAKFMASVYGVTSFGGTFSNVIG